MSYDFGLATLHSITGWIQLKQNSAVDFAGTTYGALGGDGTVALPSPAPVTFAVTEHIFSQEVRLQGSASDLLWSGSALDWTLGGFYQREHRDAVGGVTVGANWLTGANRHCGRPPAGPKMYGMANMSRALHQQVGFRLRSLAFVATTFDSRWNTLFAAGR